MASASGASLLQLDHPLPMMAWLEELVLRMRERRTAELFVVVLRLLLGFAMLPAGLKKVLREPFTEPDKVGPFHELLHAFFATGPFYSFVGACQLVASTLLLTQRFATLGALLYLPIVTVIAVFCWSTRVVPTAIVVTLMWLGTLALLVWDMPKLRPLIHASGALRMAELPPPRVNLRLWGRCGLAILGVYLTATALAGAVYRPRGIEPREPSFWLLVLIAMSPIATWIIERGGYTRSQRWKA